MSDERRQFFRVFVHLPVGCMPVHGATPGSPFACETLDLSAGGVRLLMTPRLEAGQQVRLALQVHEGGPLTLMLDALVVRATQAANGRHVCALSFTNVDPKTEQRLVQAVFAAERRALERYERLRVPLWLPVVLRLPGGEEVRGRTLDVSTEELRLVCAAQVAPGTRLSVEVGEAGGGFALAAEGQVVAATSEGEGRIALTVELEGLDRRTRTALIKNAREHETREATARLANPSA